VKDRDWELGDLIRPRWGNQEELRRNLGTVSCEYKMHRGSTEGAAEKKARRIPRGVGASVRGKQV